MISANCTARARCWGWLAGEAFAGADVSYRSTYNSDAAVSRFTEIEGYGLLNLRAGFRADNGWEASVFVKNALDEEYLRFVTIQSGNSGLVIGDPGDERTFGVTLRARYSRQPPGGPVRYSVGSGRF